MKGAIVFIVAFIAVVAITLVNTAIPPGQALYNALNVPITDYPILGVTATSLVIAVFNGAVYESIIWLVFTILTYRNRKEQPHQVQQTVNVNIQDKDEKKTSQPLKC